MNRFIKATLVLVVGLASVLTSQGAGFVSRSLLQGTGTLKLYNGTADTATEWSTADSYATNRTYVADDGTTTTTPLSTNSVSGEIRATFERAVALPFLRDGYAVTNAAISAQVTLNSSVSATNIVTFTFVRSADNAASYDTVQTFAFGVTPGGTTTYTLITNVPLAFLSGTSNIKLLKVGLGANATDGGIITVNKLSFGSFSP